MLNYKVNFKGFVCQSPQLDKKREALLVPVKARKNSKAKCSRCSTAGPACNHLSDREFLLPPLWNILVVLVYRMRRVVTNHRGCTLVPYSSFPVIKNKKLFEV
ncbi:MAG: hypothetical protein CSA32_02200 [Desulfobulbus propionicus]|nr:MAG: hypothetical protein CSA32_02200 [Desulfobulbus propionicus]